MAQSWREPNDSDDITGSVTMLQPGQLPNSFQQGGTLSMPGDDGLTAHQLSAVCEWNELPYFRDSIFDCLDNLLPSCGWSFLLPCCVLAQLSEKLDIFPFKLVAPVLTVLFLLGQIPSLVSFQSLFFTAFVVLIYHARSKARARFASPPGLIGVFNRSPGDIDDCFLSFFCSWCALAQLARHVYNYKISGAQCIRLSTSGDAPYDTAQLV